MKPAGKERTRIDVHASVEQDAESRQSRLQFSGPKGLDDVGGAADERAADENLWNGGDAGARGERAAWRAFHDTFLSYGAPPVPLVRRAMLGEVAGPLF